jgi:chaperonin GroES
MNVKPVGSRLIVKALSQEEKTQSGIILPDSAKEKPQRGEVLAVGGGKVLDNGQLEKTDIKVGDTIYYTKYGPTELKVDGQELLVIDFGDVLAIEVK